MLSFSHKFKEKKLYAEIQLSSARFHVRFIPSFNYSPPFIKSEIIDVSQSSKYQLETSDETLAKEQHYLLPKAPAVYGSVYVNQL